MKILLILETVTFQHRKLFLKMFNLLFSKVRVWLTQLQLLLV